VQVTCAAVRGVGPIVASYKMPAITLRTAASAMDTLKIGARHTQQWVVEEKHTTQRGDYRVFSTPSMTQLVESTANQLAAPHLKPGQGQVGILVTIRHMGPTPLGKKVRAEAELVAIDRRKLSFRVKVYDDVEQVGEAEHDRFVVDLDKYLARLKAKIGT
jgi:fluoroacetyl-CoA thioesterase